jgi:FKBP12-rapamycin complex-associated protein
MKTFVKHIPKNSYDGSLYNSVLALSTDLTGLSDAEIETRQHATSLLIEQTRDLLDIDLTSMASQSYDRSYQAIIEAQVLAELEEILKYKKMPSKRDWLVDTWWKRLQGCERSLEYWHRLLAVRSIVLNKQNHIRPWLKFSSLCQKAGHFGLANQILNSLMERDETTPPPPPLLNNGNNGLLNQTRNQELCKYANLKYKFATGSKREALDELGQFVANIAAQFNQYRTYQQQQQMNMNALGGALPAPAAAVNQQIPAAFNLLNPRDIQKRRTELESLLAKCYLKLGQWTYELESLNAATIEPIITYYRQSKDHNQASYKSWQAWAYTNYEAIKFYQSTSTPAAQAIPEAAAAAQQAEISNQFRINYVKQAIRGFFTCIKLSGSSDQEANCLQDTLRLLTLMFEHCNSPDIYDTLHEGIKHTPMKIW